MKKVTSFLITAFVFLIGVIDGVFAQNKTISTIDTLPRNTTTTKFDTLGNYTKPRLKVDQLENATMKTHNLGNNTTTGKYEELGTIDWKGQNLEKLENATTVNPFPKVEDLTNKTLETR